MSAETNLCAHFMTVLDMSVHVLESTIRHTSGIILGVAPIDAASWNFRNRCRKPLSSFVPAL